MTVLDDELTSETDMTRPPNLIQSKSSWQDYLQKALRQTEEFERLDRGWALLKQVRAQLEFMQSCTANGRAPTREEAQRIDVGPLAVRNFEDSQPEYAKRLMALDYGFSAGIAFRRGKVWPADGALFLAPRLDPLPPIMKGRLSSGDGGIRGGRHNGLG